MDFFHEFRKRIIVPTIEINQRQLEKSGLSYAEHIVLTTITGCQLIFGGISSFIHAICPFACKRTSYDICNSILDSKVMYIHREVDEIDYDKTS